MDRRSVQYQVRQLLEPIATSLGFELVAVEWMADSRGGLLRLSVDKPTGITADDCGILSERFGALLDEADPISAHYTLEVSSPGIDRPLQRPQDYARFAELRCKIRLEEGHPRRRFTGTLKGLDPADPAWLLLEQDGQVHRLPIDAVEKANLVLSLDEFLKLREVPDVGQ